MPYGIDGFLGTRASLMLDVVALAMVVLLPALTWSVYLVKYRQKYQLHKRIQLTLAAVLLVTVGLFEIDVRLGGWRHRADASPFASPHSATDWVWVALAIHLCFAVTAALLWIVVIARALRQFPNPPMPGPHSAWHRRFGMAAAIDMGCTAVTGLIFYYLAFVA
jgi:putative membrane protein